MKQYGIEIKDGTEGIGKVLTSDANGAGTWQTPGSGATFSLVNESSGIGSPPIYTILTGDFTVNCTSGTFTTELPTAAGIQGKMYIVKNSGAGLITVQAFGAETIDGLNIQTLTSLQSYMVQSDGTNWIII